VTTVLFLLGGMVIGGGIGGLIGLAHVRALKAKYANACQHLVWSPWEGCELQDGWDARTGGPRLVPGQKRDCLACGELEVRNVRSSNG
jgi:hypothetical protein